MREPEARGKEGDEGKEEVWVREVGKVEGMKDRQKEQDEEKEETGSRGRSRVKSKTIGRRRRK